MTLLLHLPEWCRGLRNVIWGQSVAAPLCHSFIFIFFSSFMMVFPVGCRRISAPVLRAATTSDIGVLSAVSDTLLPFTAQTCVCAWDCPYPDAGLCSLLNLLRFTQAHLSSLSRTLFNMFSQRHRQLGWWAYLWLTVGLLVRDECLGMGQRLNSFHRGHFSIPPAANTLVGTPKTMIKQFCNSWSVLLSSLTSDYMFF